MLLAQFIRQGTSALEPSYPQAEARSIVLLLCEALIGTQSYTHIVEPQFCIDSKDEEPLLKALERLKLGEPIQYVIGRALFLGRNFRVTPDVLIPRPETELLVQEAVKLCRAGYRVLDLCTGSGCIAWSVALSVPGAQVVGVDISEKALEVARSQDFSQELKVAGALAPTFVQADVLDTEQEFGLGPFDLILSNPPYILKKEKAQMRRNVLDYEPGLALFVPDEDPLLFYRAIARWSQRLLAPGGKGLAEINETLGGETAEVFRRFGFPQSETESDFFDKNRFVFYSR